MNKSNFVKNLKLIIFAFTLVFAAGVSAGTWNDPATGVDVSLPIPINQSASSQIKDGGLSVSLFGSTGAALFSQQLFAGGPLFGTPATSIVRIGEAPREVTVVASGGFKASGAIKADNVKNQTNKKLCATADGTVVLCGAGDICPNIAGIQDTIPSGYVIDTQGNCQSQSDPDPLGTGGSGNTSTIPLATCFVADTQVTLADSSKKNIQDIAIGDVLKGQTSDNTVLAFHRPKLNGMVYSFNHGRYFVTEEHPFMTTEGWKSVNPEKTKMENIGIEVGSLVVGDTVVTDHGLIKLWSIQGKKESLDTDLYNFVLSGDRTYFADGYLVHNKNSCGGSNGSCSTGTYCINTSGQLLPPGSSGQCSLYCPTPGAPVTGNCSSGKSPHCESDHTVRCY